jgi:hypothetical protein
MPVKYRKKRARKGRMIRNLCKICKKRPVAVNYYKNDHTYFRSKCDHCSRNSKEGTPQWEKSGYQKKSACDKCGFSSKHQDQFDVFYVDGNVTNCRYTNLKTVCANCQRILHKLKLPWRQGDLRPDF